MEIKKADLEALGREIDHLADIMDVTELSNEAMKYISAISVWLRNNLEKLDNDRDKTLIAIGSIDVVDKLREATTIVNDVSTSIKTNFIILDLLKKGETNESNN